MAKVYWNKFVEKQLDRLPLLIIKKFRLWVAMVEESGIYEVRKTKGFHDEPLKGNRHGERSVRLNKAYRAIYKEDTATKIELIIVLEVNKHEY